MSIRRRRTGRMKVPFEKIEKIAVNELAKNALAVFDGADWKLTRHSALYRRKDGTYTLCLIWHNSKGGTLTSTTRGIVLEGA